MQRLKCTVLHILLPYVVILICITIAVQALAAADTKSNKRTPSTKWQYLAMTHHPARDSSDDLGRQITKLGQEEWELVSVENFTDAGTTTKTVFYFKRPL